MEVMTAEDKPRIFYSGPSPPTHRIPPPDAPHGLPGAPGVLEPWRPYPLYDNHHAEARRASNNAPQPPLPSHHNYPPMQHRELPQLPPDFSRPSSLPVPAHAPTEPPPLPHANFPPMNGVQQVPQESSPASAPDYSRSRMSYPPQDQIIHTNGDPPQPPQSLPPNQYPTTIPPPVSHTPAPPYDMTWSQSRLGQRKATRAQQACDQCRTRKAKCDEGRPACSHCKENNLACVYKEVPPHKQDKSTQIIVDRVQQSDDFSGEKFASLEVLGLGHDRRLDEILDLLKQMKQNIGQCGPQHPAIKPDYFDAPQKAEADTIAEDANGNSKYTAFTDKILEPGEDTQELSIPLHHDTAAHKLLKWPKIKKLLHNYDEDYVMRIEQSRGLIRFQGRGEVQESDDEVFSKQPSLITSFNSPHTSPSTTTWGSNIIKYNDAAPEVKGINDSGVLKISAGTVRRYVQSYLDHIHRLHPFLDPDDLGRKVDEFISKHCSRTSQSGLSVSPVDASNRATKRRRTDETPDLPPSVERSNRNAIILLVLALGRICEVREEPIRGPCTDQIIDYRNEPSLGLPRTLTASPAGPGSLPSNQGSFHSPFPPISTPAPTDENFITFPDHPQLRNVDTIPGFVYYVYAARILGDSQGATSIAYVQAALLAGLYLGQLAHPFGSHSWISQASRACQILTLERNYKKLEGIKKDYVCFAFWTCLQLESDILAELDVPASGISRAESRIGLPQGSVLKLSNNISDPDTMMMFFYSTQIHLRKILNRVHTDLYKVDKKDKEKQQRPDWPQSTQEILSMNLELWRASLPREMKWHDNDPPSSDINHARMRAKYYGARYIINRPVLYYALFKYNQPNVDSPPGMPGMAEPETVMKAGSPSVTQDTRAVDMTRMSSDWSASQDQNGLPTLRDLPSKMRKASRWHLTR
ncbi:putative C6 finger domain protein [Aspergillus mulundensis]|uniref:Putative Zn(II)2Cys6 transcription factor n=1 Tax=Aspergillus mulundensis TaxID=1810919 RepID=A0A3D8SX58_9EURO|nr:putative Zn(II)2Cys6 transcription factor [Aspergillus mulundensis]RDW90849.1 putative Zn(II)2Cys6 transcription factor [Aspergillus mulundensis]